MSPSLDGGSVWVSGTGGAYLVAESSGGSDWVVRQPAGIADAKDLEFRDVQGLSASEAVLLAAGVGPASRIYTTADGGESWQLRWQGENSPDGTAGAVFLDCMDFWDGGRGLVYGDSVDGELYVLRTDDGGRTWRRSTTVPPARAGEGGFAASGDCVQVGADGWVGIVTGAAHKPRLVSSRDYGASWSSSDLPLPGGPSGGGFALAVAPASPDQHRIFVAGGDLQQVESRQRNIVVSADGAASWQRLAELPFPGAVYGLAVDYSTLDGAETLIAVGPNGVARSLDGGQTFELWTETAHWSVAFTGPGRGLMVGPEARITRFSLASR